MHHPSCLYKRRPQRKSSSNKTTTMRSVVIFIMTIFWAEAFDCGIHLNKNEELKATIQKCIRSNKTLGDLWDMTPMSSESDSSSSSEEEHTVNGKMMQSFRSKRSKQESTNETTTEETITEINQTEEAVGENCVIQCIFQNLQMTDADGYPVHSRLLDTLLKNATTRELRDFLQDSTDDCFQEMEDDTMDSCSYSTKLLTCLVEKGKTNCSDWPIGDLPIHR